MSQNSPERREPPDAEYRGVPSGLTRSGTATARAVKSVLSGVLNQAVENGVLNMNALRQVRPVKSQTPRPSKTDHKRALTRDEREAVMVNADKLARMESLDPRTIRKRETTADVVAFMAGTGVRSGEARALRWEHVDLEAGFVRLHGTKTKAARRRLHLPEWLIERLRARIERMAQHYRDAARHAKKSETATRADIVGLLLAQTEQAGQYS